MKIIDGKGAILGRLSSFVAQLALKGEEIIILNCNEVLITGNRRNIKENFEKKRSRVGSGQLGPKVSRSPHLIVKRTIRGMLPNHRYGRGKIAFKKIKCYSGTPKEYEDKDKIISGKHFKGKHIKIKDIPR